MNPTYTNNDPLVARPLAFPLAQMVVSEVLEAVTASPSPLLAAQAQGYDLAARAGRVVARETEIVVPGQFAITDYTEAIARDQLRQMLRMNGGLLAAFDSGLKDFKAFAAEACKAERRRMDAEDRLTAEDIG